MPDWLPLLIGFVATGASLLWLVVCVYQRGYDAGWEDSRRMSKEVDEILREEPRRG